MSASPTSNPLLFYFDFLSPYAYLAWCEIHNLAARHQREVVPIPVLLAALLRAHGQRGPAEIAPKREYIFKHVPPSLSKQNNYAPLPEGLFCADSLQFLSVAQVCGDAPTAREFLAVCAQQWAVSVACLLCGS
jgi:hypothetical protein